MEMGMSIGRFRFPAAARLWLVYALFVVAGIAQAAIVPLLPRLSARFALSTTETALLLALPGLATLAVSVPAGLAADRFGARRVTLLAGLLLCLANVAQAAPSLAALLAGRIAFGIGFGVVWTTGMAWLADLDRGEGRSLGPAVTWSSAGIMAGPAVGGMLAEFAGLSTAFIAVAAIAAAVLIPLAFVPDGRRRAPGPDGADRAAEGDRAARSPRPGGAARATAGISSTLGLLRRPGVAAATGALMVSGAVSGVSQLLISSGLHQLGISTGRIGLAFSAAAVCYIAVSTVVVRLGRRAHTLRFNAAATAGLAIALFPAAWGVGAAGLIAALLLSAAPRAAVSTIAYSLASVPDSEARPESGDATGESRRPTGAAGRDGLVFGLLNGAWAAAMVLMPLLAGVMEQKDGARAGYLAVILPSCVVAGWLVTRSGSGSGSGSGEDGPAGLREAAALRGAAARARVGRLIPRPDRSHPIRLAATWTGRGKASPARPSRSAGRHPARTLGRRLVRRDNENRRR
jgi:MFS transporter, YNFM family, putative membrane transport protein